MNIDEVVQILNASQPSALSPLQELVLRSAWEGKTYTSMAMEAHYGAEYLRKTAQKLWQLLSDFWEEPITKTNLRSTLEPRRLTPKQRQLIAQSNRQAVTTSQEFPSGPVTLDSSFYIPRPPIEELAYAEISEPGSVIRIKAPQKMGKSSLMLRILTSAAAKGYRSATIDFQQADKSVFASLDKFLRWFCINVSRELQLEPRLDDYWDEEVGSKVSCSIYFQGYLLEQIDSPLVLALNEVNRVFEYPGIAQDFLPLLRFWHEEAKKVAIWQKIRIVVAYSTEIYISLQLNQSPFNIGLPLKLLPFTSDQVRDLAGRYGLDWTDGLKAKQLMAMVGGHPYLVRLALYHLCRQEVTLEQLLQQAATDAGIYHDHLRWHLTALQEEPELGEAFKQVIGVDRSVRLEPILAYKLDSMGLVNLDGDRCSVSCELYRLYFAEQLLELDNFSHSRLKQLQQENQDLQELANIDSLTQLANRRYFEIYLEQKWQRLVGEMAALSVILCNIDYFKIYNQTYGYEAGDDCLQQVAKAIGECVNRPADLVARYRGDEFAVILPYTEASGAVIVAEKIRQSVKALAIAHDESRFGGLPASVVTVSLGVACTMPDRQGYPFLIVRAAEEALYQSKREGRDRVTVSR